MEYSIKELSNLAGVTARTLRYYDQIHLLKPSRITEAGYRYYSEKELAILQQILFYRERGFELKVIQKIIHDKNFDMLKAMEDHLLDLEKQKASTEALIQTVKNTIRHMKGEYNMKETEMFQSLKEKRLKEADEKYGAEAQEKYGEDQVKASRKKLKNLTDAQWERYLSLEEEILKELESCVLSGIGMNNEKVREIVTLHKEWLSFTLPNYNTGMHKGIAMMYVADERFTKYYDRKVKGCAQLLCDAVQYWI